MCPILRYCIELIALGPDTMARSQEGAQQLPAKETSKEKLAVRWALKLGTLLIRNIELINFSR